MRYWGFLVAKLALAAVVLKYGWQATVKWILPAPKPFLYLSQPFAHDLPWTLAALVLFVAGCGMIYLAILDQRYRCRVCLRRLRMPVESGSWNQMLLFGRPRIEYICPFGHGTLKVPELQISGLEQPDWKKHGDMWAELESLESMK